jgi:hypothetical protein
VNDLFPEKCRTEFERARIVARSVLPFGLGGAW